MTERKITLLRIILLIMSVSMEIGFIVIVSIIDNFYYMILLPIALILIKLSKKERMFIFINVFIFVMFSVYYLCH